MREAVQLTFLSNIFPDPTCQPIFCNYFFCGVDKNASFELLILIYSGTISMSVYTHT